jgi:glycosyltransferase involved in cell wall biosynthesis
VRVPRDIPGVCFEVPFAIAFSSTRVTERTQTQGYISCQWQICPGEDALTRPVVRWFGAVSSNKAQTILKKRMCSFYQRCRMGFALTQLEAVAHRLPVIASRRCGEAVIDHENGVLLEERTAEAIEKALQLCLHNSDQLAQFSENAIVGERFSSSCLGANLYIHVKSSVAPVMVI